LHMPTLTSPTHTAAPYRPIWTSPSKIVYNPLESFPGDHQGSRISRPLARHNFCQKALPPTARSKSRKTLSTKRNPYPTYSRARLPLQGYLLRVRTQSLVTLGEQFHKANFWSLDVVLLINYIIY
jgi:hypothetical protein